MRGIWGGIGGLRFQIELLETQCGLSPAYVANTKDRPIRLIEIIGHCRRSFSSVNVGRK